MIDFKFGFNWLFDKLGYIPKSAAKTTQNKTK